MKLIIPSRARPSDIKTHLLAKDGNYVVVVNDKEELKWYSKNKTLDPSKIVVSGTLFGIGKVRNWILKNLVKTGEWFMMADDNISQMEVVREPEYGQKQLQTDNGDRAHWVKVYNNAATPERLWEVMERNVALAEQKGFNLIGVSMTDNYFFRSNHHRFCGYFQTEFCAIKKTELEFDDELYVREELDFAAKHHVRDGGILVDNFIFPDSPHYAPGGIGPDAKRIPYKIKENAILMQRYPGLFRYKERAGKPNQTEVAVRFTNSKQVEEWRKNLNALPAQK